ncbi:MAG: hypothetical protein A2V70_09170 [Planctomycetes bacterium RBG_13_63_9]|nr:MAG: hypothetical protein A2V70_09170 [Planctomycetes bacterium RBG_13_63_9]
MDQTIIISARCGQDSDCNPANSGGVLGTVIGRAKLPKKFASAIDPKGVFSHTAYTFPALIEVSEKLVRQAVVRSGGKIEKEADGSETLVIPVETPKPSKLEQCWEPGPPAGSKFSEAEMEKITPASFDKQMQGHVDTLFPGWKISKCGGDMNPGPRSKYRGKKNVLLTHPLSQTVACVLARQVDVPAGKRTALRLVVTHDDNGDWVLLVNADGKKLLEKQIQPATVKDGWAEIEVDLSDFAGKSVLLELVNQANGWSFEAAYWAQIALESR